LCSSIQSQKRNSRNGAALVARRQFVDGNSEFLSLHKEEEELYMFGKKKT
jgi:hypothetical protein